jgi:hypothetical protein
MKLELRKKYAVEDAGSKQFHRLVLLESGAIVGFFSKDDTGSILWIDKNGTTEVEIELVDCDPFNIPALFHFQGYAGIYSSNKDIVVLYHEDDKSTPVMLPIRNSLPQMAFPRFNKPLPNYGYAGNTDDNIVPILFRDSGLLPVYIAQLQIDLDKKEASWLDLKHWGNKADIDLEAASFQRPGTPFAVLHALRKQASIFTFGIGHRDNGYLKPGMDYSDLVTINDTGTISDTLFSLGRLYKENKKGGKECIFSSSGRYAILTPVYKSDDWKNRQRLFDLQTREMIEVGLPAEVSGYRIIDHHHDQFLMADNYTNLIFAATANIAVLVECS